MKGPPASRNWAWDDNAKQSVNNDTTLNIHSLTEDFVRSLDLIKADGMVREKGGS
jgi:hypothetical protein